MPKTRRRRIVQTRGPQPMYVIAGLPNSLHKDEVDALQDRLPHAIVKGVPSPNQDGALYSPSLIESLIRSVGEFAVRRRGQRNDQLSPISITLLFVPSADQESLLAAFDFAVMSAPLAGLVARDERGRQLRHNRQAVNQVLVAAVADSSDARMNLNQVERRLAYKSDNEALLLPPKNFLTEERDLTTTFRAFRDGGRLWTDRLTDLGPTELGHQDVPSRVKSQQTRRPFVDSRGMAYFIAHPTAYDGAAREVDQGDDLAGILSALRSLYRFGGALPPGIHHDAQRSDGSSLDGAIFQCSRKGRIRGKSGYANVYPDDFVRIGKYEEVE